MRIALDIDDTITRCPQFFSVLSKSFRATGSKVYILSYRADRGFAVEDLAEHGIAYDELIMPEPADFHEKPTDWKAAAARWKSTMCAKLGIDILFDDMPEVVNAVGPLTLVFMPVDRESGEVTYVKNGTRANG